MRIGEYEIKWNGYGYAVGRPKERQRKGKTGSEMIDAKYYGTLKQALGSIPERIVAEHWNDIESLSDLREILSEIAAKIVAPLEAAVGDARERPGEPS